jgi:hypothetical protein
MTKGDLVFRSIPIESPILSSTRISIPRVAIFSHSITKRKEKKLNMHLPESLSFGDSHIVLPGHECH